MKCDCSWDAAWRVHVSHSVKVKSKTVPLVSAVVKTELGHSATSYKESRSHKKILPSALRP